MRKRQSLLRDRKRLHANGVISPGEFERTLRTLGEWAERGTKARTVGEWLENVKRVMECQARVLEQLPPAWRAELMKDLDSTYGRMLKCLKKAGLFEAAWAVQAMFRQMKDRLRACSIAN